MFVHIIPSSVWAAEWPPLGKELLTGLSISMFPLFFFNFSPVSVLFSSSFPIHITPNLDPIIFGPSFHIQCIFTYDNYLFKICFLYYMSLTGNGSLTSAAGQPCSCCATVCSCRTLRSILATVLRQTQGSRKLFARLPCGLRETNARIDYLVSQVSLGTNSYVNRAVISRLPCSCLATSKHRPKNARKMNMLKILRTALRQPCGLAKRKMVLRLPQEIPQKCVRRQVHGCRRADVKRALLVAFKI